MAASAQSLQASSAGVLMRLWRSSLGKKYVMAITGVILFGFVVGHMLGNLQVFAGPTQINEYAASLKSNLPLLWGVRLTLLLAGVLHLVAGVQLALANRRARPVRYNKKKILASTLANRTLIISGLIILAFVIFHLAHFTAGVVDTSFLALSDAAGRHDVRAMMIKGFQHPVVSGFYIVSVGLLCLHLSHGVGSAFQSLGARSKKTERSFKRAALIAATLLFVGFCSIPVAVLAGWVK
jgi:succinate dehydrogenase / fumarate reductase cytochrome b subunit